MTKQTGEIGVGIVGLGWPGEQHAIALRALPGTRLMAACDLGAERRTAFASRFSPSSLYADFAAMLADPGVDAIIIALPNFLHHSATLAALRAGKHVLCEKPPTMNVAEMEEIRAEVTRTDLVYSFGRQSRFSSAMSTGRSLVAAGELGHVYFVRAEYVRSRGIPAWGGGWFLDAARAGGGAMIDIGIHALDDAWYLLGCPVPISVTAQISAQFSHLLPGGVSSNVEDNAFAFVRFANDTVLHLEVAWAAHVTGAVPTSDWAGHELKNTTLYGTQGTLQFNPPTLHTMSGTERRDTSLQPASNAQPFELQMTDFLQAIRSCTKPTNDVDQAVALMKMLAAIYRSSTEGREILLG